MTFTYCDARHDGTPVHRCLCRHRHGHTGPHECVCGHAWGIDWNHLTYDQQRELVGLPDVSPMLRLEMAARRAATAFTRMVATLSTRIEIFNEKMRALEEERP